MSLNNDKYNNIKDWFINIYNNCIQRNEGDFIIFYYDENYIKKLKLYKLFGGDKPEFDYDNEKIVFQHDLKVNWFYVKYEGYWSLLEKSCLNNYTRLHGVIISIVNDIQDYEVLFCDYFI